MEGVFQKTSILGYLRNKLAKRQFDYLSYAAQYVDL